MTANPETAVMPQGPQQNALQAPAKHGESLPCSPWYPLFEHVHREHGLILLDSELQEIANAVSKCAPAWNDVRDFLPDSDITIIVHHPNNDEPVWLGFHDGETWRDVNGEEIAVSHWREMPEPPAA